MTLEYIIEATKVKAFIKMAFSDYLNLTSIVVTLVAIASSIVPFIIRNQIRKKNSRKEVSQTILNMLTRNEPLDPAPVISIMNSEYRDVRVGDPIETELQIITDDLINEINKSLFLSTTRKSQLTQNIRDLEIALERHEPLIEDAIIEWARYSNLTITVSAIQVSLLMFAAGIVVIVLSLFLFNSIHIPESNAQVNQQIILVVFASIISYFVYYKGFKNRQNRSGKRLIQVIESYVIEIIEKEFDVKIGKHVGIEGEKRIIQTDLAILSNRGVIPLKIMLLAPKQKDITSLSQAMDAFKAKRGMLLTVSKIDNAIKGLASDDGIIYIENIRTEQDISFGISHTELF